MLDRFAKLLGVRPDQAEDALHSERAAKHILTRRSFLGAGAMLTGGVLFSLPGVAEGVSAEPIAAIVSPAIAIRDWAQAMPWAAKPLWDFVDVKGGRLVMMSGRP